VPQEKSFTLQFGNHLRDLREKQGLSQEELGYESGLHRTHISLIERGRRSIRLETVRILAEALRLQPSELMPSISLPRKRRPPSPKR